MRVLEGAFAEVASQARTGSGATLRDGRHEWNLIGLFASGARPWPDGWCASEK
jgi:hypothetical protein